MQLDLDSRSLAVLFVRISLALYLGAAGLALLTGNTGTGPVWLPLDTFSAVAPVLGIFCVAAATLLLIGGWATTARKVSCRSAASESGDEVTALQTRQPT